MFFQICLLDMWKVSACKWNTLPTHELGGIELAISDSQKVCRSIPNISIIERQDKSRADLKKAGIGSIALLIHFSILRIYRQAAFSNNNGESFVLHGLKISFCKEVLQDTLSWSVCILGKM